MKKLTQMQAQSLFITKSTMQFIFICIFYLSFLQLDGCQNTTFLVDLQLLENLNTPYDYMQQGRQLKCQMVIAKLLATLFSLCGRNSGAFLQLQLAFDVWNRLWILFPSLSFFFFLFSGLLIQSEDCIKYLFSQVRKQVSYYII